MIFRCNSSFQHLDNNEKNVNCISLFPITNSKTRLRLNQDSQDSDWSTSSYFLYRNPSHDETKRDQRSQLLKSEICPAIVRTFTFKKFRVNLFSTSLPYDTEIAFPFLSFHRSNGIQMPIMKVSQRMWRLFVVWYDY